jgi:hypothetical protein
LDNAKARTPVEGWSPLEFLQALTSAEAAPLGGVAPPPALAAPAPAARAPAPPAASAAPPPPAAAAPPRAAASDADILMQFGMLGRIAVNCAAPASSSNPHVIFASSPQGGVTRTLKMNSPNVDGTFPLRNLRLLAPHWLQYEETNRMTTTVTKTEGGKFRPWSSVRSDGTVGIKDGKLSDGSPTLEFEVCAN